MDLYIKDALKIAIYESILTDCITRSVGAALLLDDDTGSKTIIYRGHNGNEEDSCIGKECKRKARQDSIASVLLQYKELRLEKEELRAHLASEILKNAMISSVDQSLIEAVNFLAEEDDIDCPSHCAEEYCIMEAVKNKENRVA